MASLVRLAPSLAHGLRRTTAILAAVAALTLATIAIAGGPDNTLAKGRKADPPYGPTFPFGLVQFLGQTAILAGGVYVARRWLRVRL